jgi:exosortase/archaeosortase family protein
LSARPLWQKIIITVSAIPIAIFCNVMRVAGQGLLDHYVSEQLSQSFAHQFVGIIMLIPAFFMILAVGWVLDHLFVEETDDRERNYAQLGVTPSTTSPVPAMAAPGGLVVDIPRRPSAPKVKPVPPGAQTHVAPRAVPPTTKPPQQGAKPQAAPPAPAAVQPPRPGIVPPRPGIVPPRPPQQRPPTAQEGA